MASSPQYASTPRCGVAQLTTANSALDGSGTLENVFSAGASGSRIDAILIHAAGTTTDGMIRFFINDGTNSRLVKEIEVQATTPSSTAQAWSATWTDQEDVDMPILLPAGYSLKASTEKAETFNVIAFGGDF